jgi:glutaminyl-peptide cyclotransferase
MTATGHVYEVADSTDVTQMDPSGGDTSAALYADEEVLSAFPSTEQKSRSRSRRWLWIAIPVAIIAVAAAVTGAVVSSRRHAQTSKDGSQGGTAPTGPGASSALPAVPDGPPRTYNLTVVQALPQDPGAFLEGFAYSPSRDTFFESTGLTDGKSSLRKVEVNTGKVLKLVKLPSPELFGEGIALYRSSHIYMLTWQAQRGFVFDQETLDLKREWNFTGEGWGLTTDKSTDLIYMSDGTSEIRILEPETLSERRRFTVTNNNQPVVRLNELEWVCGELWANVWMTTSILRIDPNSGKVRSVIKVDNLPRAEDVQGSSVDVLNGIAFDEKTSRLWVTGKLWPKVYQVTLSDATFAAQCREMR